MEGAAAKKKRRLPPPIPPRKDLSNFETRSFPHQYPIHTHTRQVLLVSTSSPSLKGHPTGLWLEELATPYYKFKEAGYDLTIASTAGGPIPIDAASMAEMFFTDECQKFMHDAEAVGELSHSVELSTADAASYDVVFFCGGHGAVVDFVENATVKSSIEDTLAADKLVAAVCHGVIALPQCSKPDGEPLVKGKKVSGFSNAEEDMVQLTEMVPFLLESKLREQGAIYEGVDPWGTSVSVDGKLLTGQNPQSSGALADKVIEALSS